LVIDASNPPALPRRDALAYSATRFNAVEVNGSVYGFWHPANVRQLVPPRRRPGFLFAGDRGGRFMHAQQEAPATSGKRSPTFSLRGVCFSPTSSARSSGNGRSRRASMPNGWRRFLCLVAAPTAMRRRGLARRHDQRLRRAKAGRGQGARAPHSGHAIEVRGEDFLVDGFAA
jgi:hypothetical protein